ncbi:MAG: divergent polysaccharide deacetylase family protein [Bosea sp. (in: a-proteobacteria)]
MHALVDLPTSDLQKPLGAPRAVKAARVWPAWLRWGMASAPFAVLAFAGLFVGLAGSPDGGQPVARVQISEPQTRTAAAQSQPQFNFSARDAAPSAPAPRGESSATQLEEESGVKVMRPGGADTPNSVVIRVPDSNTGRLTPAPDKRLVERTRQGMLPKVGDDGARASQVYARPVAPQGPTPTARIAILIGGLGISAATTSDAISRLPGEISLAFAPYGSDIEKQVQRARSDGHEIFLQVPMEPFDYPDNDPGPHTLLTSLPGADNLERLRWVMSRFAGYVGVVNFMGARFMSNEGALTPMVREVAERGLMVIDDGSSGRSIMLPTASGFRAPAVRADIVLDLNPRADAIDRELARLEAQAREKGFAMASASALPLTIERIGRWARTLEQRGIRLVPVSAAAQARGAITGAIR